jgi:hypothetical protein
MPTLNAHTYLRQLSVISYYQFLSQANPEIIWKKIEYQGVIFSCEPPFECLGMVMKFNRTLIVMIKLINTDQ